jgi:hypothetical protein
MLQGVNKIARISHASSAPGNIAWSPDGKNINFTWIESTVSSGSSLSSITNHFVSIESLKDTVTQGYGLLSPGGNLLACEDIKSGVFCTIDGNILFCLKDDSTGIGHHMISIDNTSNFEVIKEVQFNEKVNGHFIWPTDNRHIALG